MKKLLHFHYYRTYYLRYHRVSQPNGPHKGQTLVSTSFLFYFPRGNTDEFSSRNNIIENRSQQAQASQPSFEPWPPLRFVSPCCSSVESQLLCFPSPLSCNKTKSNKKNEWREETMWGETEGERYMVTGDIKAAYICETQFSEPRNCSCIMSALNRVLLEFQLIQF